MELKTFVVIKQVDKKHQLKEDYVIINQDQKSLKIHDPYDGHAGFQRIPEQKPGAEFSFKSDKILEGGTFQSPQLIYRDACEDTINNAINNNKNGVVIAYGQTKSGKSTTMFGNPKMQQQGLLQITVSKFFEAYTPASSNLKIGGNQSLQLSIFDINLETIRDFGKYFFSQQTQALNKDFDFLQLNPDNLEKEAAELLDNSNEVVQVRGLSKMEIKSPDQFQKVLIEEEEFRNQLDARHKIANKKYHTVYILQMKHKTSSALSYLFFLKIAGSEKLIKGPAEQKRVQEQIIANNSLFVLSKYIGALGKNDQNVSYHESKLTKALHGILQNEEKEASVIFLAHIYPVEQNYEETLLTLQYLDRLKAYDSTYKKIIFDGPMPEQVQAQERLMERILTENQELKKKYEQLQQEEKEKFDEIKRKLGLEFPVTQILKAKPNTKEAQYLLLHQEAGERSETLAKINSDLNKKLKGMLKKQEESTYSLQTFQMKCEEQINFLEKKYDDLVNKHEETKTKIRSKVKEEMKDIHEEITKIMHHGQILVEEKAHLIHGIKDEMQKNSEHYNKVAELQEMGKREAEINYKLMLNEKQHDYRSDLKNMTEQYEHMIQQKDDELKKFYNDASKYTKEKKEEMRSSRMEIVDVFEIVKKQCQTIEQIEAGNFSGGIKSFNIPKQDKQIYPEREEFIFLYKSLEKTKTLVTTGSGKVYQQYSKQKGIQQELSNTKFEDTFIQEMEHNLRNKSKGKHNQNIKPHYLDYQSTQQSLDFDEFRKIRTQDVEVMPLDQLKKFAKGLQAEIKRCKNTEPLNPNGIREQTLDTLIKERENWKQKAAQENKRTNDASEVLESQKRIIEKTNGNSASKSTDKNQVQQNMQSLRASIKSPSQIQSAGSINRRPATTASQGQRRQNNVY